MKRNVRYLIDLITIVTQKDFKIRYKNNVLGYVWSVANPLAFAFVFFIAFKIVMRIPEPDYALFLIAGLFPWQWFSNSINLSPFCFLTNASIIKKVNFPRNVLPLSLVLQDMIHFILSIPVIIFFMFIYHKSPSWAWIYGIPILLVIQFIFTYGLTLMVSSINLFFRDLERLAALAITLLFYCTPIIYPQRMIPQNYQYLINLNPLTLLTISWRTLFLDGYLPFEHLLPSLGFALLSLAIGHWVYKRLSNKFAEVL